MKLSCVPFLSERSGKREEILDKKITDSFADTQ